MGQFRIVITGVGGHGCDRRTKAGEKIYHRCNRFVCPDCIALDTVQELRQKGYKLEEATFTHWPGTDGEVVDDLLKNERVSGTFI